MWLLAGVAAGLACTAQAQQVVAPVAIPPVTGGQLLQEIPQQPSAQPRANLDLRMLRAPRAKAPATQPFLVTSIDVRGNTLLPAATVQRIVAPSEGRQLTLQQLYAVAEQLTDAYRKAGYPLSRAYVPVQTVEHGRVVIAVIEARYGQIKLDNRSAVRAQTLERTLAPLAPGAPVSNATLERTLLLLSDIPGAAVSSVIEPGAQPGTSDLVTTVTSAPRYTGVVGVDDYGNPYTGRVRASASGRIDGLLHRGDLLDGGVMSSGSGMNYADGGYTMLLNGEGTTLNVGASYLRYRLGHGFVHAAGNDLAALRAHGSVLDGHVALTHPIVRRTGANLYGELRYDRGWLRDHVDSLVLPDGSRYDNARRTGVWTATLAGDERDARGITNYRISVANGDVVFTNADARALDAAGNRTAGYFTTARASASRLQRVADHDALYVSAAAQWSNRNLDPSRQFFLGGPDTIEGYDTGALGGDEGAWIELEWRHDFAFPTLPGSWQLAPFVDAGRIVIDKQGESGGPDSARIYSGGLHLGWISASGWRFDSALAKPVGAQSALTARVRGVRIWLAIQKGL